MKFNYMRYFQTLGIGLGCLMVVLLGIVGYSYLYGEEGIVSGGRDSSMQASADEDGIINCLVIGVDADEMHSDIIMLASYRIQSQELKLLSIPRDTYMYIGTRYQKINASHAIGAYKGEMIGAAGTVEAVERLTNIPIDYYVEFNFSAIDHFMEIVGPVTFTVPDIYGDGVGMKYDDPVQDLHINLRPGTQELSGNQVQQLLRYRKDNNGRSYPGGDNDRIKMQQSFLETFVDQKLNLSLILKIPAIFKQLQQDIKTNLTVSDVISYIDYIKGFSSDKIEAFTLPGESEYIKEEDSEKGEWYWKCDLKATKTMIEDIFWYDASKISIDQPKASATPTAKGRK